MSDRCVWGPQRAARVDDAVPARGRVLRPTERRVHPVVVHPRKAL